METLIFFLLSTVIVSALIILCGYFLRNDIKSLSKKIDNKQPEPLDKQEADKLLLPLKIQAYERMILYVERIELEGLVMRSFFSDMSVQQLQNALTRAMREEYEHNLTQQLHVSETAWEAVRTARDLNAMLISQTVAQLNPDENGIRLAEMLFVAAQNQEVYPYNDYGNMIKKEMKKDIFEK